MSDAGPPTLRRRAALTLAAAAFARGARAGVTLAEAPTLLVAGPAGGRLDRWATQLIAALAPGLPAGTRLLPTRVGGDDGVTGANQFTTRVPPDGNTLLLTPGDAVLAWLVGDPRARFDVGQWLGVVAGIAPAVVCGRAAGLKPGARIRVGMSGPVSPDLAAVLGLELAGLTPVPVFGGLAAGGAAQALSVHAVDAMLLRGAELNANLGPLAQVGAAPLFSLGAIGGEARDPQLLAVPTLAEYAASRGAAAAPGLFAAWRGVAAAAQTEFALVLPLLTPAALVALWRTAGSQAASAPEMHDEAGRTRSLGTPAAHTLAQALSPEVPAIAELRSWLATRLDWRPPA